MQFSQVGFLASVQRWDIRRSKTKGGRVFMLADDPGLSEDRIGLQVVQPAVPYEMFDQLRFSVPGFYKILLESSRGAGNRDTERVLALDKDGEYSSKRLAEFFKPVSGKLMPESYYQPSAGYVVGLVVGATCYSMEDENTGRVTQGGSITFLQPLSAPNDNFAGYELFNVNIPYDFFEEIRGLVFPGEYKFRCQLIGRSRGRPGLLVTGVEGENTFCLDRFNAFFGFSKASSIISGPGKPDVTSESLAPSIGDKK